MNNEVDPQEHTNISREIESWIFSLTPVGVAFAFYIIFIMQTDLANKGFFMAIGATAGFIGLETYWIAKGVQNKRMYQVILGLVGIAISLGLFYLYLSLTNASLLL